MDENRRPTRNALVLILGGLLAVSTLGIRAQTSPQTRPLVQAGNLVYLGNFTLPQSDGSGGNLAYGGAAIGMGPDGQSLYYGCQDGSAKLARVTIPALGGVSTVLRPCTAVPNLQAIKPSDTTGIKLGGSLSWNTRLIVSAYVFYDGTGTALSSHFGGPLGVSSLTGPYRVGNDPPGMVGGYMGVIPQEWRSLLGGPALTGKCCTSVIWRSSYGPTASVFDPDHVGTQATIPSTMLVGYPDAHQTLGPWEGVHTYYTGTQRLGGLAFPAGTRSLLFVSRRGDTFCYGDGAECNDPSDPDKGTHGYPYRHVVTAYDANDLLAVKQGTKQPWEVLPYTQWTLPEMNNNGTADMASAAYDPATRRWYIRTGLAGGTPVVHVYEVTNAVIDPPTPVEVCGDGIDNDGDGLVDENCTEVCGDGVDNDGDGLIDETCIEVCVAASDNGAGSLTGTDCSVPTAEPGVPVGLNGSASGSTMSFTWSAPPTGGAVAGYDLEVGTAPGMTTSVTALGLTTSASVPGMTPGSYYVRVRSRNQHATSTPSNEVVVTVASPGCAQPPGPLSSVVATTHRGLVTLKWAAPDGCNSARYVVTIGTAPGAANVQVFNASANKATTLLPVGTYYARIVAVADSGVSEPVDHRFTVRDSGCAVPRFRAQLTANVSGSAVGLAWAPGDMRLAQADDDVLPVSYVMEVGSVSGATDIGSAPMGRVSSFSTIAPAGVYFVRVRAVNACGSGQASEDVRLEVR